MDLKKAAVVRDKVLDMLPGSYLWGGTLLGEVRDGGIIQNDEDVDIIVPFDLYKPLPYPTNFRVDFQPWFVNHTGRAYAHCNVGYVVDGIPVGVHTMMDNPTYTDWVFHSYWFDNMASFRKPVGDGPVPDNAEDMLQWQYGTDWRVPQRMNHKSWASSGEYKRLRARYEIKQHDPAPWSPPEDWHLL